MRLKNNVMIISLWKKQLTEDNVFLCAFKILCLIILILLMFRIKLKLDKTLWVLQVTQLKINMIILCYFKILFKIIIIKVHQNMHIYYLVKIIYILKNLKVMLVLILQYFVHHESQLYKLSLNQNIFMSHKHDIFI